MFLSSCVVDTFMARKPSLNSWALYEPMFCAFILLLINIVTVSLPGLTPRSSKNFCRPSISMLPVVASLYLSNVC